MALKQVEPQPDWLAPLNPSLQPAPEEKAPTTNDPPEAVTSILGILSGQRSWCYVPVGAGISQGSEGVLEEVSGGSMPWAEMCEKPSVMSLESCMAPGVPWKTGERGRFAVLGKDSDEAMQSYLGCYYCCY